MEWNMEFMIKTDLTLSGNCVCVCVASVTTSSNNHSLDRFVRSTIALLLFLHGSPVSFSFFSPLSSEI